MPRRLADFSEKLRVKVKELHLIPCVDFVSRKTSVVTEYPHNHPQQSSILSTWDRFKSILMATQGPRKEVAHVCPRCK
jgi:hypothetical protein